MQTPYFVPAVNGPESGKQAGNKKLKEPGRNRPDETDDILTGV